VKQPSIPLSSTIQLNALRQVNTTQKNKYLRVCADYGVSFLPFIDEINGYIHPSAHEFLRDLQSQNNPEMNKIHM
jgi:hypothetical protein